MSVLQRGTSREEKAKTVTVADKPASPTRDANVAGFAGNLHCEKLLLKESILKQIVIKDKKAVNSKQ